MGGDEVFQGWDIRESGPVDAPRRVLLLPGGMCSPVFYEDLMAAPPLADAPVRLIAATVPGMAGTRAPRDPSVENYAALAGTLAANLGCDVVVGHSFGGNIALEMAAGGHFSGPVVLLSPTFSRPDEMKGLGVVDRIGRVPGLGALAWSAAMWAVPRTMSGSLPPARRAALVADLKRNDASFCRRSVRQYFGYLDRHGSLVGRLCDSGVPAWVVFGEHDEVKLTDEERAALMAAPAVTLVTVPGSGHLVMVDQPVRVAELIARVALGSAAG